MQKSKLIELAEETEKIHQERRRNGHSTEEKTKSIKLTNAIIRAICDIDDITPHVIKIALKMTEEILETVIANEVIT